MKTTSEQLIQLAELVKNGLLTKEEFEVQKKELLASAAEVIAPRRQEGVGEQVAADTNGAVVTDAARGTTTPGPVEQGGEVDSAPTCRIKDDHQPLTKDIVDQEDWAQLKARKRIVLIVIGVVVAGVLIVIMASTMGGSERSGEAQRQRHARLVDDSITFVLDMSFADPMQPDEIEVTCAGRSCRTLLFLDSRETSPFEGLLGNVARSRSEKNLVPSPGEPWRAERLDALGFTAAQYKVQGRGAWTLDVRCASNSARAMPPDECWTEE